jgi:hypothetical protein
MPEGRKWFDSSQPQTLQGAVMLCYITAAFALLYIILGSYPLANLVPLGLGVSGYGIANERRWAYVLGLVLAGLNVIDDLGIMFVYAALSFILTLLFAVVLFALLVHPQSREYQRIWFK